MSQCRSIVHSVSSHGNLAAFGKQHLEIGSNLIELPLSSDGISYAGVLPC